MDKFCPWLFLKQYEEKQITNVESTMNNLNWIEKQSIVLLNDFNHAPNGGKIHKCT